MKKITINGVDRPIKFGVWAIRNLANIRGKTMEETINGIDKMGVEDMMTMIYCAFVYGAKLERLEIDFIEEDVWFWLEDKEVSDKAMSCFSEESPKPKNLKASATGQ